MIKVNIKGQDYNCISAYDLQKVIMDSERETYKLNLQQDVEVEDNMQWGIYNNEVLEDMSSYSKVAYKGYDYITNCYTIIMSKPSKDDIIDAQEQVIIALS